MTQDPQLTCSLRPPELERRIAAIAQVGAGSLVSREVDGDRHRLRFRSSAPTRRRLEEIVAAESECCSFLDLSLSEEGEHLLLSIAAPDAGKAVADGLAKAFAG